MEMGILPVEAHRGLSDIHLFQFCVFRRHSQHSNVRCFGGSSAVIFKCTPCSLPITLTYNNKGHCIDNYKQRGISHNKI